MLWPTSTGCIPEAHQKTIPTIHLSAICSSYGYTFIRQCASFMIHPRASNLQRPYSLLCIILHANSQRAHSRAISRPCSQRLMAATRVERPTRESAAPAAVHRLLATVVHRGYDMIMSLISPRYSLLSTPFLQSNHVKYFLCVPEKLSAYAAGRSSRHKRDETVTANFETWRPLVGNTKLMSRPPACSPVAQLAP